MSVLSVGVLRDGASDTFSSALPGLWVPSPGGILDGSGFVADRRGRGGRCDGCGRRVSRCTRSQGSVRKFRVGTGDLVINPSSHHLQDLLHRWLERSPEPATPIRNSQPYPLTECLHHYNPASHLQDTSRQHPRWNKAASATTVRAMPSVTAT